MSYIVIKRHTQSYKVIFSHMKSYVVTHSHIELYRVIQRHSESYIFIHVHTQLYKAVQTYIVTCSHTQSFGVFELLRQLKITLGSLKSLPLTPPPPKSLRLLRMHEYLGGDRNSPINTLPLPMHYGPNRGSMCSFLFTQHRQLVPFPTSMMLCLRRLVMCYLALNL